MKEWLPPPKNGTSYQVVFIGSLEPSSMKMRFPQCLLVFGCFQCYRTVTFEDCWSDKSDHRFDHTFFPTFLANWNLHANKTKNWQWEKKTPWMKIVSMYLLRQMVDFPASHVRIFWRNRQAHASSPVSPHEGYVLGIFRGDLRHPGSHGGDDRSQAAWR